MVKTGIPFMLEDKTGSLSNSNFVDLYGRMSLLLRCTSRDTDGASQYSIYNLNLMRHDMPVATLEYGAAGALGDITTIGPGGSPQTQPMAAFLVEVGGYATSLPSSYSLALNTCAHTARSCFCEKSRSSRHRKFIASDGNEYSWIWRMNTDEGLEWSVSNSGTPDVSFLERGRVF
jgi:hypothetical protein